MASEASGRLKARQGSLFHWYSPSGVRAGRTRKVGIACSALVAASLSLGVSAAPAMASHPLQPDLVTLPLAQGDLSIVQRGPHTRILLENRVGNRGLGPMEIFASPAPNSCGTPAPQKDPYYAMQRTFTDSNENNVFERSLDTGTVESQIGCLKYHSKPGHQHWHVLGVSGYTLISERDGSEVDGRKAGYCLLDVIEPFGPSFPQSDQFYGSGGCGFGTPGDPPEIEGISPGWADVYGKDTPGQFVNVTGVDPGRYCLRSEADPLGRINEMAEGNNVTEVRLRLDPEELAIKRLAGACQLPR
jgi:hypothetical protein